MSVARIPVAAVPLLVVGVALALWLISDRLVQIGPIDRGTFAALVVIPLWAVAPVAAGFAWRGLDRGERLRSAIGGAVVLGTAIAALAWIAAVTVSCRPAKSPLELVLPAVVVGVVVGAGFGLACRLAGDEVANGHPWRAVVGGGIVQLALVVIGPSLAFTMFFGLCQRP
jgi:hypothetical protein